MNDNEKSFQESMIDWFAMLGVGLRAALASPILDEMAVNDAKKYADPDFQGWLRDDPMVTMNPASRYGDHATDFLAGSGDGESIGVMVDD